MKASRVLVALTVLNVGVLLLSVMNLVRPAFAEDPVTVPILRARSLQIVDEQGRIRASLSVLPASTSASGVASAETVLLRLITERGRPSVKVGASEEGAGITVVGPPERRIPTRSSRQMLLPVHSSFAPKTGVSDWCCPEVPDRPRVSVELHRLRFWR